MGDRWEKKVGDTREARGPPWLTVSFAEQPLGWKKPSRVRRRLAKEIQ